MIPPVSVSAVELPVSPARSVKAALVVTTPGGPAMCSTPFAVVPPVEAPAGSATWADFNWTGTVSPLAVLTNTVIGTIESVNFWFVCGFSRSVNFSANTSEMIFCASGDNCTPDRKLTVP